MTDKETFTRYLSDPHSMSAVQSAADLPTERSASGTPTLSYQGLRLHSAVNPMMEAEAILEKHLPEIMECLAKSQGEIACVVSGPGLGYVVSALSEWAMRNSLSTRLRILCVEANPEVARKALQLRVWESATSSVTWFVGREAWTDLKSRVSDLPFVSITATAGYRLARTVYDDMIAMLRERSTPERPLRILVPTPLYGGSYPIALHCGDALRQLGHDVEVLDFSAWYPMYASVESTTGNMQHRQTLQGLLSTFLGELVAAHAIARRVDLVWAVAQSPMTPAALEELRRENILSAFWFVEDYQVFEYWRILAKRYDAFFTIQHGRLFDELRDAGARNVHYLPCAANPSVHRPLSLNEEETARWGADVSFVGAGYRNRQNLFARLRLLGLKIWGNDWPADCAASKYLQESGRRVSTEETAKIYNATKINLNLHSSPRHAGVNPEGDFVNPRTFEIAACGGFQLTDARSEMAELFSEGEIMRFHDSEEIPALVNYYLDHEQERKAMAARARERVLSEHTYEHRMKTALDVLRNNEPRLGDQARRSSYASSLKRAAEGDAELEEFLAKFPNDQEVTLDDIVARIEIGKGELTRAEGLFLLMKEFRDWGREKGVIQ